MQKALRWFPGGQFVKKKRGFGAVFVLRNVNDRSEAVGKLESSAFFGVGFRFGGRRSRNVQSHGSNPTQGLWGSGRIKNKGGKLGFWIIK